ncbi:MAG: acetate--CoA ligase [Bdellovibrionota bacterium]
MPLITKSDAQKSVSNMRDYEATYKGFTWEAAKSEFVHMPSGGMNIAYSAVDAQVEKFSRGKKTALRWCSKSGEQSDFSYAKLFEQTNRFANGLARLGIGKGDGFFALMPRQPELYIGMLGALKRQCVFSPLFSAFGPEPIKARMDLGCCKVLLTTAHLYKRKIVTIKESLKDLRCVIIADELDQSLVGIPGVVSFRDVIEHSDADYITRSTDPEDNALLHFTSGTTGLPKGAIHVHGAVLSHYVTGRFALDLKEEDVFWCTADPGWVTGTSYGIISPLTNGVTMIVDEGEFDAERWYEILDKQKVTVWYTAPTAIRMMMKMGEDLVKQFDTSSLKLIASVGEPLNPEAIRWGLKAFGLPIHDNWWQTETGGIMIANFPSMDIKPGSMGKPLPGVTATILKNKNADYVEAEIDEEGELALKVPWPSMFRGYLGQEERYKKCFTSGGWYLSGDLARKDSDNYFWFIGRADDVIKSAGHLIGPFEVESALIEHEAIAEAAVIGKPDPMLMEVVKAYVTLNDGYLDSENLRREIMGFARKKLGPAVAPREIEVKDSLPRTRSGKIMRRLLKARELGLPEGDISTLEIDPTVAKVKNYD